MSICSLFILKRDSKGNNFNMNYFELTVLKVENAKLNGIIVNAYQCCCC